MVVEPAEVGELELEPAVEAIVAGELELVLAEVGELEVEPAVVVVNLRLDQLLNISMWLLIWGQLNLRLLEAFHRI